MSKRRQKLREMLAGARTGEPDRYLSRMGATRHLLHGAIRLVLWEEDPFVVHLAISAATRVLQDLAKARSIKPDFAIEDVIKDEYRDFVGAMFVETYDFLRHADETPEDVHGVRNIVSTNELELLFAVQLFEQISNTTTRHIFHFYAFMNVLYPDLFIVDNYPPIALAAIQQARLSAQSLDRGQILEGMRQVVGADPKFHNEREGDLADLRRQRTS